MNGGIISRHCQSKRVRCDDLRLLIGTPSQKRALAGKRRMSAVIDYSGMESRKDPRQPIFRDHNCWKCREGERPCVEGNYNRCSYPHARND